MSAKLSHSEILDNFLDIFSDCELIFNREELLEKIKARDGSLRVKFGVDPTATEIHLGWMVPLLRLRKLQALGHKVILVVGDFTATIGDPSGKSATRKQLTLDEVFQNGEEICNQFGLVLDLSKTNISSNWTWWKNTSSRELLSMLSEVTVAQIMERKDFAERFSSHQPIGMHELIYPILQGRDSVMIDADVELGGNDQRFNCLMGRDMMSSSGMMPQAVVLTPLLVGLDGVKKMSQSLGNFISIRDNAFDMFGKVMSIPDNLILDWWGALQLPDFERFKDALETGFNPKNAKLRLAELIVSMCHGEEAGLLSLDHFVQTFTNKNWKDTAPDLLLSDSDDTVKSLAVLLVELGMASSNSEAKRLIFSGAVELGGDKITSPATFIVIGDIRGKHLKVGKRKFAKLI